MFKNSNQRTLLHLDGYAVAHLVEALRYKPEGRGFDSRWGHLNFSLTQSSGRTMVLGSTQPLTQKSTRDIFWGVKAASALGRQYESVQACNGIALHFTRRHFLVQSAMLWKWTLNKHWTGVMRLGTVSNVRNLQSNNQLPSCIKGRSFLGRQSWCSFKKN